MESSQVVNPSPATATASTLPASPWSRRMAIVLAGSVFVAISAHVSIPLWFTPVPLTLQPFAVLVLGLLLSPPMAFATLGAYLAEGAMGLPVFTPQGPGGLAQLFGPTGGYLLSYPLAAALMATLVHRGWRGFVGLAWSAAAGNVTILSIGALWLGILSHRGPESVLTLAVVPFLPGDALKVVAAAGLVAGLSRFKPAGSATGLDQEK